MNLMPHRREDINRGLEPDDCLYLGKHARQMTASVSSTFVALLMLGLHDGGRAWKDFDWGATNRLFEKGYITDPRGKAKSVVFTEEGFERSQESWKRRFGKRAASP